MMRATLSTRAGAGPACWLRRTDVTPASSSKLQPPLCDDTGLVVRRVAMVVVLLAAIAGVAVAAVGALSGGSATNIATRTGQHTVAQTPASSGVVEVVQTSADLSQRLTHLRDLRFEQQLPTGIPVIDVDDGVRYQRIEGVGAAMTDTSAWLIHDELPPAASAALMRNLFGPDGVRLRVIRVPIGASDFTRDGRPYSYDDLPAGQSDPSLTHFSVAHDDAYIVPELRAALRLDRGRAGAASPWSPPGWMKRNGALDNFANTGTLLRNTTVRSRATLWRSSAATRPAACPSTRSPRRTSLSSAAGIRDSTSPSAPRRRLSPATWSLRSRPRTCTSLS